MEKTITISKRSYLSLSANSCVISQYKRTRLTQWRQKSSATALSWATRQSIRFSAVHPTIHQSNGWGAAALNRPTAIPSKRTKNTTGKRSLTGETTPIASGSKAVLSKPTRATSTRVAAAGARQTPTIAIIPNGIARTQTVRSGQTAPAQSTVPTVISTSMAARMNGGAVKDFTITFFSGFATRRPWLSVKATAAAIAHSVPGTPEFPKQNATDR